MTTIEPIIVPPQKPFYEAIFKFNSRMASYVVKQNKIVTEGFKGALFEEINKELISDIIFKSINQN